MRRADGSGEPRAVFKPGSAEENFVVQDWTHDGTALIIVRTKGAAQQTIVAPVTATDASATPNVLVTTKTGDRLGRLSPDGHYFVFLSDESGRY